MAKRFVQKGDHVTLTAPTGGVTTDVPVLIGSLFCIPLTTAAAAASFEASVTGVWDIAKAAVAIAEEDKMYWDAANAVVTNVPGGAKRLIGHATAAALVGDANARVRLLGVAALLDDDSSAAATSKNTAGAVTLTAAEILTGAVVADPNGANRTYTLPTAALLVAALPGVRVGDKIDFLMTNGADAAEVITIQEGAGGTWDANQTAASRVIGQNGQKTVRIRFTNVTAGTEAYTIVA